MRLLTIAGLLFFCLLPPVTGQTSYHEKYVSFDYDQVALQEAILHISIIYRINFSYSKDQLPLQQPISVYVQNVPLSQGLDALFSETKVVYSIIGTQVALRLDPKKPIEGLSSTSESAVVVRSLPPRHAVIGGDLETLKVRELSTVNYEGPVQELPVVVLEDEYLIDTRNWQLPWLDSLNFGAEEGYQLAQVSIVPEFGTNMGKEEKQINHFSVNLLWGANAGVEGVEIGGLANHISGDMDGVQLAGLYNQVEGTATGFQAAGLGNVIRSELSGVQMSGLFNTAGAGTAKGVQMAGLFNTNKGTVQFQAAGLFNTAKEVQGLQIGLFNFADTVSGVSIGLFNFVQHGYNRVELSAGEALYTNMGFKLGARSFYNILHAGMRWDPDPDAGLTTTTWGLGYGIGTAAALSPRLLLNIEGVALHINERNSWTKDLNLLNQLRLSLDYQLGHTFSFFAGGTFNVMVSRQYQADTGIYGSHIAPYTWLDHTTAQGTNVQLWAGINAGIRF